MGFMMALGELNNLDDAAIVWLLQDLQFILPLPMLWNS